MTTLFYTIAIILLVVILTIALLPCILILLRVLFPTVLTHPWKLSPNESPQRKREKESLVVFAGSFNPPHWGHLVMIRYLAERYGSVICCIGVNPTKRYDVTPNERAEILKAVISSNFSLNNVRVEVVSGYIWRYARTQKARLFYRGIRTWSEDGADELKLLIQNTYGPLLLGRIWPINTVFLEGDPRYRSVSSTLVRELCGKIKKSDGNDESEMEKSIEALKRLVPDRVVGRIVEVYGK
eukprot:CCRYP_013363-RA/>CCRYP_013363-RA protein AED:0.12 eAED:0.12 QI:194/1/1/1/0.5/0.66/3/376/239